MRRVGAALAILVGATAAAAPPSAARFEGRYPLDVVARLSGEPLGEREVAEAADAVVTAVAGRPEVRIELTSGRYRCALAARVEANALALRPGQTCLLNLDEPAARGRVEARLRSGRGRLEGDVLVLEAAWDLAGEVSLGPGGQQVDVFGTTVQLPGAAKVPVRGAAESTGRGARMRR